MWWSLLLACNTAPTSQELAQQLSAEEGLPCEEMPLAGARTTCLVTRAADAGKTGDAAKAQATCEVLQDVWADECHFRAGEELGKTGLTDAALRQCAQAGDFARNCITHAAWGLPRREGLNPSESVGPAMAEFQAVVENGLNGAPGGVVPEAVDTLMARAWFNLYVGSGNADPTAAKDAGDFGPHARSAWAIEAIRLAPRGQDGLNVALACWRGEGPCPAGEPIALEATRGRYNAPIIPPSMERHPHVSGFGGSNRLVDEDPEQDVQVALLEAAWFREDTPPSVFELAFSSPVDTVRWTSCKLLPQLGRRPVDLQTDDPICNAYVVESHRRGRKKGPGPDKSPPPPLGGR